MDHNPRNRIHNPVPGTGRGDRIRPDRPGHLALPDSPGLRSHIRDLHTLAGDTTLGEVDTTLGEVDSSLEWSGSGQESAPGKEVPNLGEPEEVPNLGGPEEAPNPGKKVAREGQSRGMGEPEAALPLLLGSRRPWASSLSRLVVDPRGPL